MTEKSYFWKGLSVGDAVYAKYGQDILAEFFEYLFQYDSGVEGVVGLRKELWTLGQLKATKPASNLINIDSGIAIIQGTVYSMYPYTEFNFTSSNEALPRYYRVVLRKDYSARTVRMVTLGPNDTSYPAVTQVKNLMWEIPIAKYYTVYGLPIELIDERTFIKTPFGNYLTGRQGGDLIIWSEPGEENYRPEIPYLQTGVAISSSTNIGVVEVTFPVAFEQPPIIKTNCKYSSNYYLSCMLDRIDNTGFSGVVRRGTNQGYPNVEVHWVAIGPPEG